MTTSTSQPQANSSLRVFIASPSDVHAERMKAKQIVDAMADRYRSRLKIDVVFWEHEPLLATEHPQAQLEQPRAADVVVVILWSRLGTLLPVDRFQGAISGNGRAVTGTEWEFEDAIHGFRETWKPNTLVYHKQDNKYAGYLSDRQKVQEALLQAEQLDSFIDRWFRKSADGRAAGALLAFHGEAEFADRFEKHLMKLIDRRVAALPPSPPAPEPWSGSPFRGLESFELRHAAIFYGRRRAAADLRAVLERQIGRGTAFVLVLGASGTGKSSLVKAGLLADLDAGLLPPLTVMCHAITRPADKEFGPLFSLAVALRAAEALPELGISDESLVSDLASDPARVAGAAGRALQKRTRDNYAQRMSCIAVASQPRRQEAARLVLVVDQLEELFTVENFSEQDRDRYVTALEAMARSGWIWVIATLRSDFLGRLESVPALNRLADNFACYRLPPPESAELNDIIVRPAEAADLRFQEDPNDGPPLSAVIREAAHKDPTALPLLSYLLEQLWNRRNGDLLTFAAWQSLGGLHGVIGTRAEAVVTEQSQDVLESLPRVIRTLVQIGDAADSPATARWASRARFPAGGPADTLIEALIAPNVRLLIADGDRLDRRIRVAHEALLNHWPRAIGQITVERADLQLRTHLEQRAGWWSRVPEDHRSGHLLTAGLLAQAENLQRRWGDDLAADTILGAYISASVTARNEAHAEEQRQATLLREVNDSLQREMSERRAAEEERDRLFDLSIDMLIISTLDGYFRRVNPAVVANLGYGEAELLSTRMIDFVHPEDVEVTLEEMRGLAEQRPMLAFENRFRCRDGTYRWFSWNAFPKDNLVYSVARDVTEQKGVATQLEQALFRAEAASRAKSDFLANMSHELRTPLNGVIGYAEALGLHIFGTLNPKQLEYVNNIRSAGTLLLGIVNDLLDLSVVEAGRQVLAENDAEVGTLIHPVIALVHDRAMTKQLILTTAIPYPPPVLRCDELKVKQVLINLVVNAIKFTEPGGTIHLDVTIGSNGDLTFAISDTGIGIASEDLPKVIMPFGQVEPVLTRKQRGVGLGLPLAKKLTEMQGGTLLLESEVGVGTKVHVCFPRSRVVSGRPTF